MEHNEITGAGNADRYTIDDISSFEDGYFKVKNNNLYGIIDLDGNIVIPIEYTEIKPYNGNSVLVKRLIVKE